MNTVHPILDSKYGCWLVNKIPFSSKVEALRYASQLGNPKVYYYFHNHVWENIDKTLLGKVPLTSLYKERALQLRDKYDYLILHYSGGSDSHNILHTFLSNNIKLDEVMVRWPKPLVDGKFYTPNTQDTSARNSPSEWDFAIKPTLDYLKEHHPDIKINVVDYGSNLSDRLLSVDHIESRIKFSSIARGGLASALLHVDPKVESAMSSTKIDSVGHVLGIEKPVLHFKDNAIYFQFMDSVWDTAIMPRLKLEDKVEAFYWSPDMPLLPVEQAYQSALWFKLNKEKQQMLTERTGMTDADYLTQFSDQGNVHKAVLYKDSWNTNTFQVGKPNISRSDWYFWLFESPEMVIMRQNWGRAMLHFTDDIHDSYLTTVSDNFRLLRPIHTKLFHLLDMD